MGLTAYRRAVDDWRSAVVAFGSEIDIGKQSEPAILRGQLYRLYGIIERTPPTLLQKFDSFDEEELATAARASMLHLSAFIGAFMNDDEGLLWAAVVTLRALDELLQEGAESVADAESCNCWLTAGEEAYVVPVPRTVMTQGGPRTRQNFYRRGLLYHRIIPARIGDVDILIERHPDVALDGTSDGGRLFGAALFQDLNLNLDLVGDKGFLVTSVNCPGGIGPAAEQHCDDACEAGCDTLIWPELTLEPDSVDAIQVYLAEKPLTTNLPPVVVAGSWHVLRGDRHYNLAPVLDGRGGHILTFGKSRRFSFKDSNKNKELTEGVDVYGKVHIIATDRELIAFAICKDFCDKASAVPVLSLDVDLVLVPSMGQTSTVVAHRDAADAMKVRYGTRVVVVQQNFPIVDAGEPLGYVLRAPKFPSMADPQHLAENLSFTTFQSEK